MILYNHCRHLLAASALLVLSACGGGGDSGGTAAPGANPMPTPTTGTYAWLLKAEGRIDSLKFALSLVHPQDTATEVLIEPASAAVTDAKLVSTASVDVASLRTGALDPYALVYIVGGDVRRVPLRANGSAPLGRVARAGSTSACRFVLDGVDHVAPERSRFVVSTAGADGQCDTPDDARAEVRLDAGLGLVYTPLSGGFPLAVLRDASSLAPTAWLLPTQVLPWSAGSSGPSPYRTSTDPVARVVQSGLRSALAESTSGLSLLNVAADGTVAETRLSSVTTTGWQSMGFDAQNHYVFRNGGTVASPTWTVLRIARSAATVTQLGSGAGQISLASMGTEVLYATILVGSNVETRRLLKAVPNQSTLLDSGPQASSFSTVLTSASGVHLFWRITGLGTAAPSYAIQMVNETSTVPLYSSSAGGFSLGLLEAGSLDFNSSESRSRFVFAEGYGARFFGDATLVSYDASSRMAIRVGVLPGTAEFGQDYVFANVGGGPASPGAGFASRSINGVVQASGTRVFTFDATAANSLRTTTRQQ